VLFLPWLVGSMAPGAQRRVRGGFVNMGLDSRRVDLARAVLEGVALNAAWLLPSFCALAGASYDEISFGGGGASSSVWGQVLADCTGLNVRRLSNSRTTNAHGAALLALQQAGHIAHDDIRHLVATEQLHEPDPGTRELHARRLGAFIDFHERAVPFYDALNSPESRTP
jgi:xylulokinase